MPLLAALPLRHVVASLARLMGGGARTYASRVHAQRRRLRAVLAAHEQSTRRLGAQLRRELGDLERVATQHEAALAQARARDEARLQTVDVYLAAEREALATLEQHVRGGSGPIVPTSASYLAAERARLDGLASRLAAVHASLQAAAIERQALIEALVEPLAAQVALLEQQRRAQRDVLRGALGRLAEAARAVARSAEAQAALLPHAARAGGAHAVRGFTGPLRDGSAAALAVMAAAVLGSGIQGLPLLQVEAAGAVRVEAAVAEPAAPAMVVEAEPAEVLLPPPTSVLEQARIVALYGHPGHPATGALGRYTPEEAAREVMQLAAEYEAAAGQTIVGALQVTVAVAQSRATADGTYLERLSTQQLEPYVAAARAHGLLLILDVQIGWADPLAEVQALGPLLREPFVHLALDPEFATKQAGVAPGATIGSLDASAVNAVQDYLATIVQARRLPKKLLILHQFRADMLTGTDRYRTLPEVDRVVDMDGFGPPGAKIEAYEQYALAPYAQAAGMKLFFGWDAPMLTTQMLLALPRPPAIIIYQ